MNPKYSITYLSFLSESIREALMSLSDLFSICWLDNYLKLFIWNKL